MKELSLAQMLETEAYQQQKVILSRAINTDVSKGGDISIFFLNRKEFEHTKEDREMLYKLRKLWRETMRFKYGPLWTKRGASRSYGKMN